jgi:hypothetical protein
MKLFKLFVAFAFICFALSSTHAIIPRSVAFRAKASPQGSNCRYET